MQCKGGLHWFHWECGNAAHSRIGNARVSRNAVRRGFLNVWKKTLWMYECIHCYIVNVKLKTLWMYECIGVCIGNAWGSALWMHGGLHWECRGVCIGSECMQGYLHWECFSAGTQALRGKYHDLMIMGSWDLGWVLWSYDHGLMRSGWVSGALPRGNTMILWSWAHEIWGGSYDLMIMSSWDLGGFLNVWN